MRSRLPQRSPLPTGVRRAWHTKSLLVCTSVARVRVPSLPIFEGDCAWLADNLTISCFVGTDTGPPIRRGVECRFFFGCRSSRSGRSRVGLRRARLLDEQSSFCRRIFLRMAYQVVKRLFLSRPCLRRATSPPPAHSASSTNTQPKTFSSFRHGKAPSRRAVIRSRRKRPRRLSLPAHLLSQSSPLRCEGSSASFSTAN